MIPIKSKKEIKIMRMGGRILARVMAEVIKKTKPGVKTKDLDQLAERLITENEAGPSFKKVPGYHWASCINVNDGLVHGIPGNYRIKSGDVVTIDLGVYYQGFHTDMARTFWVAANSSPAGDTSKVSEDFTLEVKEAGSLGGHSLKVNKFLKTGKLALKKAIDAAKPGNYLGHISRVIQETIEKAGYSCSRKFTGHGVGEKLHEEPKILCFLEGKIKETPILKTGMVLAIEVIYTEGGSEVKVAKDGWTVRTVDGKLGGLFEDTVAITKAGPRVLTMV